MALPCVLAVDAGGTFFKTALLTPHYDILCNGEYPACSDGNIEQIKGAWISLLKSELLKAQARGVMVERVAISTPGPYDFEKGIPLMKHKFLSAYGVSILPWINDVLPGVPVCFMHDATSFMLGQLRFGAAKGAIAPAAVMLGTGFGFSNVYEGRIVVNPLQTSFFPIWRSAYLDGTVEDYVSRRALRARYAALTGKDAAQADVKDIADHAKQGDKLAKQVFLETGSHMGAILCPVLERLSTDLLVLGGQIAKAHDLFEETLLPALPCPMVLAKGGQDTTLKGAAAFSVLGADSVLEIRTDDPVI